MNKKQIIEILKELISDIDYDIYKDMFVYNIDDEETQDQINNLVAIVENHLSQPKISKPRKPRTTYKTIDITTESGDDLTIKIPKDISLDDFKIFLMENFPDEWVLDDDNTYDGPGFYGSYIHVDEDDIPKK